MQRSPVGDSGEGPRGVSPGEGMSVAARAPEPWWKSAVIYQIYPRSFQDANGDGVGDLAGVLQRLDYLVDLGVDALWLSPFYRSPMADFGYDVRDHVSVDPIFGDMADVRALVHGCRERGLKLIVDYIPNHTSDQHLFAESRSSRTNPRRDWFIWRDAAPDGGPPNNWRSEFGGAAWTLGSWTRAVLLPRLPQLPAGSQLALPRCGRGDAQCHAVLARPGRRWVSGRRHPSFDGARRSG